MAKGRRKRWHPPGTMPGTLTAHAEARAGAVSMRLFRYDAGRFEERVPEVSEIAGLSLPEKGVMWLDVVGLSEPEVVKRIGERFGFHPLALEDVLNTPQRPKVDHYGHSLLIVLREIRYPDGPEQLSLFLSDRLVVTFQERSGDAFERIRDRIRHGLGEIRSRGADFLTYALCDASIDSFFPTLERLGEEIDRLEDAVIDVPIPETFRKVHDLRRRLIEVRRAVWPARDAMNELLRDESGLIRPETKIFLRDCYDHTVQVMDMVETFREMASGLVDEYMSSVGNRLNEIIKVLTIITTIFIPLSFIASLYGMNFDPGASPFNMPELRWRYGYPAVLALMAVLVLGMLFYFRRKRWL